MNGGRAATVHDVSPEVAMGVLGGHSGPILLDLDETLYLRNSTEDYIDAARPRLAALLLLRLLELCAPWRWTGGEVTRDVWRLRLVALCFPRTGARWKAGVGALAQSFGNPRLMAALTASGQAPIIATAGFQPIVEPLVAALGLAHARIVAARGWSFDDRRAGKLRLTVDALGQDTVRRSLVLTDSADDLGLLDACARPLRAVWPEARFRSALSGVYLPGRYLTRVKRPGARYIVRGILQEDFAFWVLSSIGLAAAPAWHVLGLLCLLVSFWTIYERGYVDNDLVAARHEAEPKLSAAFSEAPVATPSVQPWLWAAGAGTLGLFALRRPGLPTPGDFEAWAAVLAATYGWFKLYNRLDKSTRVWLFAGLQLARSAAFVVLVPIVPAGALALGAHVLARWVPYHVYRLGGKSWPEAPLHLIRLLFFAVLLLLMAVAEGARFLLGGSVLVLLAWCLFRARQEIAAACKAATRIDRQPAAPRP